jgi:hypothetical protein
LPVTYEQYKNLIRSIAENTDDPAKLCNETTTKDPLLRDFLLCDGR